MDRGNKSHRGQDIAWHCSMVSKPQERIPETESCRQYSYLAAAAGVAIPTNASANNAVTGAPDILKSCFILFSPCADFSLC